MTVPRGDFKAIFEKLDHRQSYFAMVSRVDDGAFFGMPSERISRTPEVPRGVKLRLNVRRPDQKPQMKAASSQMSIDLPSSELADHDDDKDEASKIKGSVEASATSSSPPPRSVSSSRSSAGSSQEPRIVSCTNQSSPCSLLTSTENGRPSIRKRAGTILQDASPRHLWCDNPYP